MFTGSELGRGGDRYSLIFYDTSNRRPTPIMPMGVDADWLEVFL